MKVQTGWRLLLPLFLLWGGHGVAQDVAHGRVLVQLDGSESHDADGDALVYEWSQVEGPTVRLVGAETPAPQFHASKPGMYRFQLVVSDGEARSEPVYVEVRVEKGNRPPIAVVPERVDATLGESVTLDGTESHDPDGDALTYRWEQVEGPPVMLDGSILRRPGLSFTPPRAGTYVFALLIHDGTDESAPARTTLVVTRPNLPPVARVRTAQKTVVLPSVTVASLRLHVPENQTLRTGETVVMRGRTEPEADGVRFAWRQTAGPEVLTGVFDEAGFVFTPRESGVYIFECIAMDEGRTTEPAVAVVTVLGEDVLLMQGDGSVLQQGQVRLRSDLRGAPSTDTSNRARATKAADLDAQARDGNHDGIFSRMFRGRSGE